MVCHKPETKEGLLTCLSSSFTLCIHHVSQITPLLSICSTISISSLTYLSSSFLVSLNLFSKINHRDVIITPNIGLLLLHNKVPQIWWLKTTQSVTSVSMGQQSRHSLVILCPLLKAHQAAIKLSPELYFHVKAEYRRVSLLDYSG